MRAQVGRADGQPRQDGISPLQPRLRLKFQGPQGQSYASILNMMENYIYAYADKFEWYSNRDYAADQMRAWWTSGEKVFWWAAKGESGVVPRFELHNVSTTYPRTDFVFRQSGTGQKYWSIQFQPNQSNSTAQMVFHNELAGANVLALYNQNVGIGTATPSFPLVIFRENYSDLLIDSISDSGVPRLFGRRARGRWTTSPTCWQITSY